MNYNCYYRCSCCHSVDVGATFSPLQSTRAHTHTRAVKTLGLVGERSDWGYCRPFKDTQRAVILPPLAHRFTCSPASQLLDEATPPQESSVCVPNGTLLYTLVCRFFSSGFFAAF